MGNNLIIVSDYIDKNSFFKKYQDKTDVLALTPIAISWFDNEKIPYLTIEDFYDTKQYCSDLKQIYLETGDPELNIANLIETICNEYH